MTLNEADKKVHPVETQWHYPIMTKHGFVPETMEATGFVRRYVYNHPDGRKITCNTGVRADYWDGGNWDELDAHLTSRKV